MGMEKCEGCGEMKDKRGMAAHRKACMRKQEKTGEKGEIKGEKPSPKHSDFLEKRGNTGEKPEHEETTPTAVVASLTHTERWEKLREIEREAKGERGENKGETPSPQHSEISGKTREKEEKDKGGSIWSWVAAGVGSLIVIGAGILLGGKKE